MIQGSSETDRLARTLSDLLQVEANQGDWAHMGSERCTKAIAEGNDRRVPYHHSSSSSPSRRASAEKNADSRARPGISNRAFHLWKNHPRT